MAGFHFAAISQPGSEEHWPPGPDSPVGSLSEHPAAACMPDRLQLPGREGCRMLWPQTLWERQQTNDFNSRPMDLLIHPYLSARFKVSIVSKSINSLRCKKHVNCFERTLLVFTLHFRKGVCEK